jgi:hypothetical protein
MRADPLARLKAADPAAGLAMSGLQRQDVIERVRAAASAPPRTRRRWPRLTARRTFAIAALIVLGGGAGAGVAALSGGQSARQVERSYASVTRHVPLPPGYRWPRADVQSRDPASGAKVVYAGHNAALMQATGQATCAWWDYWRRSFSHGDSGAMAAALAGHARVVALTPRHRAGDSEDAGGADASVFAYEAKLVVDARAGRPQAIDQYLKVNCGDLRSSP